MSLWEFLALVFDRYNIAINLEYWYFLAVQSIGFLPVDQVNAVLLSYGHTTDPLAPFCGMTFMVDDGQFNRSVPQIWIAEPEQSRCTVETLRFSIEHELRHVLMWIRDGVTSWSGHP